MSTAPLETWVTPWQLPPTPTVMVAPALAVSKSVFAAVSKGCSAVEPAAVAVPLTVVVDELDELDVPALLLLSQAATSSDPNMTVPMRNARFRKTIKPPEVVSWPNRT
jgi:hypothetical protein